MSQRMKRLLTAALALAMVGVMVLSAGFVPARSSRVTLGGGDASAPGDYELYTDDTACFRLEYPADSEVSQEDGAVYFSASGDFVIGAQFVYSLNEEVFVYSAADMAALFNADASWLAMWTGADEAEIVQIGKMDFPAGEGICIEYTGTLDGDEWSGRAVLFDGLGDFGCYCVQAILQDDEDAGDRWELFGHVCDSFEITGAYQPEGMTVYEVPDWEMEFMVHDEYLDDAEYTDDPIGQSLRLQPADLSLSDGSILIDKMTYGADEDVEDIMDESLDFILSNKDDAQVLSEPETADVPGRFNGGAFLASYTENGADMYTVHAYLGTDDGWWSMIGTADEEGMEPVLNAMFDVLYSARFGGGDRVKVNAGVAAILDRIEGQDGFCTDPGDGFGPRPIGSVTDVNGDGSYEFLALYELERGGSRFAVYELWTIQAGGALQLDQGVLYEAAGSDMGTVFLYEKDGAEYLGKWAGLFDDDGGYTSRTEYTPLSGDESALLYDEATVLESVAPADGDDEFYIDGEAVSESAFDEASEQYELRMVLNWFGGAFAAPGDDTTPFDSMMDFDELRQHDFGS